MSRKDRRTEPVQHHTTQHHTHTCTHLHIKKNSVRAPTLIALGKRDRRVPFSQGLEFHYALKARGVPTKLLVYEQDVHAIDRPVSEADHWLQIAGWLEAHL